MASTSHRKIVQYLDEAHATESGLVRDLQAQIAMTPSGRYRSGLERHLEETRDHVQRLQNRLDQIGPTGNPLAASLGLAETLAAQSLALAKAPIELLRGRSGEEKVLKNAKDSAAAEALEIATYTALEELATELNDQETARLAASIRADEERMLEFISKEIPALTKAVVQSEVRGNGSYDIKTTGAAETARKAGQAAKDAAKRTAGAAAQKVRKAPGADVLEETVSGATAKEEDLPIPGYDSLTADEIASRLSGLSQGDLIKVAAYERAHESRQTVLERIDSLRDSPPWANYDEQNVDQIRSALSRADAETVKAVRDYERGHKNRTGVIDATERALAGA
jgi:ferritin-like metal-binding protein YciE